MSRRRPNVRHGGPRHDRTGQLHQSQRGGTSMMSRFGPLRML